MLKVHDSSQFSILSTTIPAKTIMVPLEAQSIYHFVIYKKITVA
jgi:hypothetical protein